MSIERNTIIVANGETYTSNANEDVVAEEGSIVYASAYSNVIAMNGAKVIVEDDTVDVMALEAGAIIIESPRFG